MLYIRSLQILHILLEPAAEHEGHSNSKEACVHEEVYEVKRERSITTTEREREVSERRGGDRRVGYGG